MTETYKKSWNTAVPGGGLSADKDRPDSDKVAENPSSFVAFNLTPMEKKFLSIGPSSFLSLSLFFFWLAALSLHCGMQAL